MDDPSASEFCDRIRVRLVGSLTLYCGDPAVAEELAQDALLRAWERWPKVGEMASPEAWTFRTAVNLANSWHRRRAAERRAHQRHGVVPEASCDDDAAQSHVIRTEIAQLPDRQRAVIIARFYLGLDVAQTATALGCADGTVKAATHAALAKLRASGLVEESEPEVERS